MCAACKINPNHFVSFPEPFRYHLILRFPFFSLLSFWETSWSFCVWLMVLVNEKEIYIYPQSAFLWQLEEVWFKLRYPYKVCYLEISQLSSRPLSYDTMNSSTDYVAESC